MRSRRDEQTIADELEGIALDTVREVRSNKHLIPICLGALCILAIISFFALVFPLINIAAETGQTVGESIGQTTGLAVGLAEGFTQGLSEGYHEGTQEGLSGNDTVAEIANTIKTGVDELGRLEVLAANAALTDYHEVGKKYGALYLARCSVVFTVDLNQADITYNEQAISIAIPEPEAESEIDPSQTEVLAEWQRKFFNGKDSEGFQAALNSFSAMKNISESEIENYTTLKERASKAASEQIKEIVKAVQEEPKFDVVVIVKSN